MALADMVAMWLAGHPPAIREDVLRQFVGACEALVAINAKMAGMPE